MTKGQKPYRGLVDDISKHPHKKVKYNTSPSKEKPLAASLTEKQKEALAQTSSPIGTRLKTMAKKNKGKEKMKEVPKKQKEVPLEPRKPTGVVIREGTQTAPPSTQPKDPPTAPSSTQSKKTVEDFLDKDQLEEYQYYAQFKAILETRKVTEAAIRDLGIKEKIESYLKNLSRTEFARPKYNGFKNLTMEFFSTLKVDKKSDKDLGAYVCRFQLFGKWLVMPKLAMDACFGFSSIGYTNFTDSELDIREFWREISASRSFKPALSPSKCLKTIGLYVLHKIICNTVFCKKDGNDKVAQKDLLFMYCAIKNKPIQTAFFFIDHLIALSGKGSAILAGSYVTKIAYFFKFDLEKPQAYPLTGELRIGRGLMDISSFIHKMKIIVKEGEGYMYLGGVANEDKAKEKAERKMKIKDAAKKRKEVAEGDDIEGNEEGDDKAESSSEDEDKAEGSTKISKIDVMYDTLYDMTKHMKRQEKWQAQVNKQLKFQQIELLRIARALDELRKTKNPKAKPTSSI